MRVNPNMFSLTVNTQMLGLAILHVTDQGNLKEPHQCTTFVWLLQEDCSIWVQKLRPSPWNARGLWVNKPVITTSWNLVTHESTWNWNCGVEFSFIQPRNMMCGYRWSIHGDHLKWKWAYGFCFSLFFLFFFYKIEVYCWATEDKSTAQ